MGSKVAGKRSKLADVVQESFGIDIDDITEREIKRLITRNGTNFVQWMSADGVSYSPATTTTPTLPPGFYEPSMSMDRGFFLEKLPIRDEGLLRIPNTLNDKILEELSTFWSSESKYRKHNLAYKRGILMHGPPGSGKSAIIRLACNDVIERGGIVVKFTDPELTEKGLRIIRDIQEDIPVVCLMEDIDTLIERYIESSVLNLLDGVVRIDKIVFLATTNYPEKLGGRVVNRPSRFDRRFFVGMPDADARRLFLTYLSCDASEDPKNTALSYIDQWVKDTEGMSMAHLKELFVSVVILGTPYDDAITVLRNMSVTPTSEQYSSSEPEEVVDSDPYSKRLLCEAKEDCG